MQISEFFMPYLLITCGEGYKSHEGTLNIDYQGRNESGRLFKAPIYAPFDLKCVYSENSYASGNTRVFQSLSPVKTPIGDTYVSFYISHDENPICNKGDTKKKGETIGHTGNYGYSTGDHVHVSAAKGEWAGFDNSGSHQQIKNAEHQYNLFYVDNVVIEDGAGYDWRNYMEYVGTPVERNTKVDQINVVADVLRARKEPTLQGEVLGYANKGYYNIEDKTEADGYTWYKVQGFWIAYNPDWEEILPKELSPEDIQKEYKKRILENIDKWLDSLIEK